MCAIEDTRKTYHLPSLPNWSNQLFRIHSRKWNQISELWACKNIDTDNCSDICIMLAQVNCLNSIFSDGSRSWKWHLYHVSTKVRLQNLNRIFSDISRSWKCRMVKLSDDEFIIHMGSRNSSTICVNAVSLSWRTRQLIVTFVLG